MDLKLDKNLASGYKSAAQIARIVTEGWAEKNLYCVACSSPQLNRLGAGAPVRDFCCPSCGVDYQLKAKGKAFGPKVSNSAYEVKMKAISSGKAPNYIFLNYSKEDWVVQGLFVIPGHFFTPAIIERRPPLPSTTRRAGWVGSNILLGQLQKDARVVLVAEYRQEIDPNLVRKAWQRFAFLGKDSRAYGGWGADVLECVRQLQEDTGQNKFSLQNFYQRFESELSRRHPANQNVQAKIRQQLQVLRDGGTLQFLSSGQYLVLDEESAS